MGDVGDLVAWLRVRARLIIPPPSPATVQAQEELLQQRFEELCGELARRQRSGAPAETSWNTPTPTKGVVNIVRYALLRALGAVATWLIALAQLLSLRPGTGPGQFGTNTAAATNGQESIIPAQSSCPRPVPQLRHRAACPDLVQLQGGGADEGAWGALDPLRR